MNRRNFLLQSTAVAALWAVANGLAPKDI